MKTLKYIVLIITAITFVGCKMQYGLTQPTTTKAKTFQVNYFQNNAPLIEPGLERDFTNSLTDLVLNQTSLALVRSGGDIVYEGEITEYRISPTTATADNTAAQNRLTISVNVRFYDKTDEDAELEQRFSFFYDYAGNAQLVGSQKDTAITEIFDRLTQDILNATLAKW
jgi:hypothetical protein